MNKVIKYSLLLLAITISLVSCTKWIDLKPNDGIIREEFWQTKEQVQAAVNGIYSSMLGSTSGDLALPEYFFIWGEGRTDMVTPGFKASPQEYEFVNVNIQPNNNYTNWRALYQTINYCNTLIELAPAVLKNDNTFTKAQLDQAVAEATTIRSLMYFYLVRTFRDVPMKLTATISDENIQPIPKTSGDSILTQMVSDLKASEAGLPYTYGNANTDKGRVTRFTLNALLADIYLWQEKYAESATECDKIIASNRYGLVGGNNNLFNALYYQGNSSESIFELQYDANKLNPFYYMHLASTRRWGASARLMDEVFGVDLVNAIPKVDARGDGCSLRPSDLTIWKYVGANSYGNSMRAPDQSFAHWIFYRYADVLLMKAEAINQTGKSLEASRLVKTIRDRANAIDFNGTMDSTSKSGMEDFILQERQREFAFEGKRWYDVLRNAKRNNYAKVSYILNMASISVPSDRQQVAFNKLRDKNSHYLPIYLYELQTNNLLVQNPFYK